MLIYTVGYCAWTSRKDITLVFLDILVQTLQFESLWIPIFHTKFKSFCLDVSGSCLMLWRHSPEGDGCRTLPYWLLLKAAVVTSEALQVTQSW